MAANPEQASESREQRSEPSKSDFDKFDADLKELEARDYVESRRHGPETDEERAERRMALQEEKKLLALDGVQKGLVVEVQQPHPGARGAERATQLKAAEAQADEAGLGWLKENIADGTAERELANRGYSEVVTPDATQSYWLKPRPKE